MTGSYKVVYSDDGPFTEPRKKKLSKWSLMKRTDTPRGSEYCHPWA